MTSWSRQLLTIVLTAVGLIALMPKSALAWGGEGHRIIALVAERFLDPAVPETITAMLAADPESLTAHDIASAVASYARKLVTG
jgi:hypothetical protein